MRVPQETLAVHPTQARRSRQPRRSLPFGCGRLRRGLLVVPVQLRGSLPTPYRPCSETYNTSARLLRQAPSTVFARRVSRWRASSMTGAISRPCTASCSISGRGTSGQAAVTQIRS
jgi:hypothetical protein